ncbi:bifunctional metallophosphatase/5'-nucleotidase [Shimazuella sp. AN120528]|uniref:bifunctional metallophosphatase/5'-nucleotidase n=1 Tax=Shimazuella soli TaxID=1892854 RepID=UPI001F0E4A36|nr:bifunctional UDP-sugar hydrolase/5'-nucleotidase [Shimazuella soli]MCH5585666.1 bifunctional metallophosphatase/5'-nucleotidase [Shimazuella soli]
MKRIHLIHTNDIHSHLEAAAQIDTYVSRQRKQWEEKGEVGFLVDIGDHLDRARWETEGTDGLVNRAILETSEYDVVTLGNNELLTFSHDDLYAMYTKSSFYTVCSNVEDPLFLPYQLYECAGVKLAFIGVTVWFDQLYQSLGWKVTDPFVAVRSLTEQLRAKGYLILVLSHLGYPSDVKMAEEIPGIDVIMGGHTHHLLVKPEKINHTTLAAAGKYGNYIGHLQLLCDDEGNLVKVEGGAFPLEEEPSPRILAIIKEYQGQASEYLNQPVAELEEDLIVQWDKETPLPNLLADSLVKWTGVEYGLVNNGQMLYSLPQGLVTKGGLHTTCPHPINPVVIELNGKDLRYTLEESLLEEFIMMKLQGFGFRGERLGSMAISGITVKYNPMNPPYQKIQQIFMGKDLLVDDNIYHIATISMFVYGKGYKLLSKGRVLHYYVPEPLRQVLANGIQSYHLRKASKQKRWIISSPKEEHVDNVPEGK